MLTEKDRLQDILSSEKDLIKIYGSYLTEASIKPLREILKDNMYEVANEQFEIFSIMQAKNYYSPKQAQEMEIETTIDKFQKEKNCICREC